MAIPLELVDEIVHHIFDSAPPPYKDPDEPGKTSKPRWELIESFTLSCRAFRLLGLASWFRRLYLKSGSDMLSIDQYFPVLKSMWCRQLHCVQSDEDFDNARFFWDLSGFKQLSSLRVDWLSRHTTPHRSDELSPFINVESQITEVEICGVRYPSPMMLKAFTCPFVHLVTLKLDFPRIWCGLCHTCIIVRFPEHPPTSLKYEGGLGLPLHYGRSLFALDSLEEVFIRLPDLGPGLPSPGISATSNDNLWAGECDRCMMLMYEDDEFRKSWVARKKGLESVGVKNISTIPPRLKSVHWNFWRPVMSEGGTGFFYSEEDSEEDFRTDDDGSDDRGEDEENSGSDESISVH